MKGGRDIVAAQAPLEVPAPAGRNVIVAIGVDRYASPRWPALRNAVSDAVGATRAFQQLGFEEVVPPLLDERATRDAIEHLVTDELAHKLRVEDSLVVFYAGHGGVRTQTLGAYDVDTGHLIPVDASERFASWIELVPWLEKVARLPPRHILVILDACKTGIALSDAIPRTRDSATAITRPYAEANRKQSRLLITSASEGEVALDSGPSVGHSLFTGCLIDALIGGGAQGFVHDGRPVTIGSNLAYHVRNLVQTYPGEPGWRQTPVVGRIRHDKQGEMLIPMLAGDAAAPPARLAHGSNEIPVAAGESARVGASGAAAASSTADALQRRSSRSWRRRAAMIGVAVAMVGLVLAAGAWRLGADEAVGFGGDSRSRSEPVESQMSVLASADPAVGMQPGLSSADASVGSSMDDGRAGAAVGSSAQAGSADAAGGRSIEPNTGAMDIAAGASPSKMGVAERASGVPTNLGMADAAAGAPRQTLDAAATNGSAGRRSSTSPQLGPSNRVARPITVLASPKRQSCRYHCDGPRGVTVEWNEVVKPLPADLALPCGIEVELTFRQDHRYSGTKKVTATPNGVTKGKSPRMRKVTAAVDVVSTPRGATIAIGKRLLGLTPATIKLPEDEAVTLTISKSGYAPSETRITPGIDRTLSVELTRFAR